MGVGNIVVNVATHSLSMSGPCMVQFLSPSVAGVPPVDRQARWLTSPLPSMTTGEALVTRRRRGRSRYTHLHCSCQGGSHVLNLGSCSPQVIGTRFKFASDSPLRLCTGQIRVGCAVFCHTFELVNEAEILLRAYHRRGVCVPRKWQSPDMKVKLILGIESRIVVRTISGCWLPQCIAEYGFSSLRITVLRSQADAT